MLRNLMRGLVGSSLILTFVLIGSLTQAAPLTPGETYTVSLGYLNSDGTVTEDVSTTTAIANDNGKITFTFQNVPNQSTCNFLLLSIEESDGTTIRRAIAPSPPAGGTTGLGISDLTETQASTLLTMATTAGTDDPIMVAFALVIVRSADMSTDDAQDLAIVGNSAILGPGGFVDTLGELGVTEAQLDTFREALLYNSTAHLGGFTELFKDAVEAADEDEATEFHGLAGGLIGDIFIAAGKVAGIDETVLVAALEASGDVAGKSPAMNDVSAAVEASVNAAMSVFHRRLSASRVRSEYTSALTTLNASGAQLTRFYAALDTLVDDLQDIDMTYEKYFSDPETYPMTEAVQNAMNADFNDAFGAFILAVQSTNEEIAALKTAVAAAFGIDEADLGEDFGTEYDYNGNPVNISIPQCVAMSWVASIVQAGGGLTYTRDTMALPDNLTGWGFVARSDFSGLPESAETLMGLAEDVMIIQAKMWDEFDNIEGEPTMEDEKNIMTNFANRLEGRVADLGGTTDGATPISTAQKEALIKMFLEPDF